jgi:predicted nucleic acid-binding protein
LGNTLSPVHWRQRFISLLEALRNHPAMTIVPASAPLFGAGITLFSERSDKDWSLTDCISFTIMRDHGLHDALTADAHFQQAGFRALLLE